MYTIIISLHTRQLKLYKDSQRIQTYPIAVGKPATPTPKGSFIIINKAPNPGGVFGAMWLGLSIKGYGIHGTNNPRSIGRAVSNGCIRMHNKDIMALSRLIPVGTTVKVQS